MTTPRILGVIPARLRSTRLPEKVLMPIAGRPMVHWVYLNARRSSLLTDILIATDDSRVFDSCAAASIPVMMTGEHPSGSDRLREVMTRTDADIYVNIQGDEPTLRPEHVEALLAPLLADESVPVSTLSVRVDADSAANPNVVKVVTDIAGRALYFSRAPIPHDRDGDGETNYQKHIGMYAYRRDALERFHALPQSPLEKLEKLEQLRLLENGIPIQVAETPFDTIGVDTEEDLRRVIALFGEQPTA